MRIVVVSATSVIAKACVLRWAETGTHEFALVGRSQSKLDETAADLRLRCPDSSFVTRVVDFGSTSSIGSVVAEVFATPVDLALVAQGSLTEQNIASTDLEYLQNELTLNAVSVGVFSEALATRFEVQGRGTLGIIGSVAGDRGRAYNYSYGAAKALVETYAQGLQQRFASGDIDVCLIKPGPTATPMTANHPGQMADPAKVAKVIVSGLVARRRVIYAPKFWRWVMLVVRLIPFVIFKKLTF